MAAMDIDAEIPHAYICPLTQEIMVDPVVDPEGNSFERAAITEWLRQNPTSPVTRRRLAVNQLAPNRALQEAIEEWKRNNNAPGAAAAGDNAGVPVPRPAAQQQTQPAPTPLFVPDTALGMTATVSNIGNLLPGDESASHTALHVSLIPPADTPHRTPVDLVCVVDVSGSMGADATVKTGNSTESSGLTVLDIVRHALNTMAHTLDANDRMMIITFSDNARTVLPLTVMDAGGITAAAQKISNLRTEGSTNIHAGLQMALDALVTASRIHSPRHSNPFRLPCIALLTDGQPNMEPPRGTLPTLLRRAATEALPPITTFGFGYDVESVLLRGIAKVGRGMYSFIPDAGMVGTSFVNSVAANFARVPVRQLAVKITGQGCRVLENGVLGGGEMDVTYADGGVTIKLADGGIAYGQSRDFVVRLDGFAEGSKVDVEATWRVPVGDRSGETEPKSLSQTAEGLTEASAGLLASYARLHLHDMIQKAVPPANLEATHALFTHIHGALPATVPAAIDIKAQVVEAYSRRDWYDRWGRHYLPSLARAHMLQTCHNFKDAGVQGYGGPEGAVFDREREKADKVFLDLPPPEPTGYAYDDRGGGGNVGASHAPINMRMYNDADNPCFSPDSPILLPDGSTIPCSSITAGILIATPSGPAKIQCIVKTLIRSHRALLCRIAGMKVTPWHPIRKDGWKFPCEIIEPRWFEANAVYSFVLEKPEELKEDEWQPVMTIGGIECITLGHDLKDDRSQLPRKVKSPMLGEFNLKNVVEHPYFGSKRVIEDLATMPGWERGLIEFEEGCMIRAESGEGSGGDALLRGFDRDKVVMPVKCGA